MIRIVMNLICNIFILGLNIIGGIYNAILWILLPKESRENARYHKKRFIRQ